MNRTRTAVAASRTSRRATATTWLVSTSHGTWEVSGGTTVWAPHGVRHARAIGSGTTACGESAFTWELFWDTQFVAHHPRACPDCARFL